MNVVDLDNRLMGCFGIVGGSIGAATGANNSGELRFVVHGFRASVRDDRGPQVRSQKVGGLKWLLILPEQEPQHPVKAAQHLLGRPTLLYEGKVVELHRQRDVNP
jgi:hypothetical protein